MMRAGATPFKWATPDPQVRPQPQQHRSRPSPPPAIGGAAMVRKVPAPTVHVVPSVAHRHQSLRRRTSLVALAPPVASPLPQRHPQHNRRARRRHARAESAGQPGRSRLELALAQEMSDDRARLEGLLHDVDVARARKEARKRRSRRQRRERGARAQQSGTRSATRIKSAAGANGSMPRLVAMPASAAGTVTLGPPAAPSPPPPAAHGVDFCLICQRSIPKCSCNL